MRASRLLPAFAILALAPLAEATPVCTAPARLMQWPTLNPVWELCFRTPVQSTGPNGSGIELTDVTYQGHLVLKRAHAPILNVLYKAGCGCFRDWSNQETRFEVINASGQVSGGPGAYAEASVPPRTVCDVGGSQGDLGSFRGVAAEKLGDELILTSQFQAGWYRYLMKWRFFLDGRIESQFGFGALAASCIAYDHTHHVYWRLDFDIDGAANDYAGDEASIPASDAEGVPAVAPIRTEVMRRVQRLSNPIIVQDSLTHRGYRILAKEVALSEPADTFAVGDVWLTRYNASQISDSGGSCATTLNNYVNGESVYNQDLVVWVRGGAFHAASDLDDCHRAAIRLEPVGSWNP